MTFASMQKTRVRKIWKWVRIILLIYIIIGITLYFLQNKFFFHPEKLPADHQFAFTAPFKEINLAVNSEKNLSIVQFTVPDSLRKGIVLYFHGNRKNIERYAQYASHFFRNHYEVWMLDYPGFGKSTGERSEQIMYDDATILFKMAKARIKEDSIIIYGKSLGTGVASYLASRIDCKRLILETPYSSADALAKRYAPIYPVGSLIDYHFPIDEYLERVTAPIDILHGTNDEIIPISQAKYLTEKYKTKVTLTPIEKGKHNNLADFPKFQAKLDELLRD